MAGTLLLLSAALLGQVEGAAVAGAAPPGDSAREAYAALKAAAGRDADAQARLALWCESHGLTAERARHLALAVLADPQHGLARALLGHVRDGDAWRRPEEVAEQ